MDILFYSAVYAFIGVFAGLMSGILGIGGGIIVVPGLVFIFQETHFIPSQHLMQVAAGTSLAAMMFTSLAALRVHYKIGEIQWTVFRQLWPGLLIGVLLGALTAQIIPTTWLKTIFAFFLFFVLIKMLLDVRVVRSEKHPPPWVNLLVTSFIGLLSGMLGIGGGVLIVPYLSYCGLIMQKVTPLSNLCTLTVAITGTLLFIITGYQHMAQIPYASGYVYWPAVLCVAIPSTLIAPFGVKLSYILKAKHLKYGFIVILFLTALRMISS